MPETAFRPLTASPHELRQMLRVWEDQAALLSSQTEQPLMSPAVTEVSIL